MIVERFVGIDVGAETIKLAELWRTPDGLPRVGRCHIVEHHKQPNERLLDGAMANLTAALE